MISYLPIFLELRETEDEQGNLVESTSPYLAEFQLVTLRFLMSSTNEHSRVFPVTFAVDSHTELIRKVTAAKSIFKSHIGIGLCGDSWFQGANGEYWDANCGDFLLVYPFIVGGGFLRTNVCPLFRQTWVSDAVAEYGGTAAGLKIRQSSGVSGIIKDYETRLGLKLEAKHGNLTRFLAYDGASVALQTVLNGGPFAQGMGTYIGNTHFVCALATFGFAHSNYAPYLVGDMATDVLFK